MFGRASLRRLRPTLIASRVRPRNSKTILSCGSSDTLFKTNRTDRWADPYTIKKISKGTSDAAEGNDPYIPSKSPTRLNARGLELRPSTRKKQGSIQYMSIVCRAVTNDDALSTSSVLLLLYPFLNISTYLHAKGTRCSYREQVGFVLSHVAHTVTDMILHPKGSEGEQGKRQQK